MIDLDELEKNAHRLLAAVAIARKCGNARARFAAVTRARIHARAIAWGLLGDPMIEGRN